MLQLYKRIFFIALVAFLCACSTTMPLVQNPVSSNQAVISLIDMAMQHRDRGDYASAGSSLERALRIEPNNGYLWKALAELNYAEGNYREAESLALRGNSYANSDEHLRKQLWSLVGDARREQGNHASAQEAYSKANSY